jgi:hypothetical protein
MDAAEPYDFASQGSDHGPSIHIDSPGNRIAARDYIELTIHIDGQTKTVLDMPDGKIGAPTAELLTQIRNLVAHAMRAVPGEAA